ncbi:MAG TPA: hypothetical protein VHG93_16650 [Longimicrobium sp.]|nr:hypothetical protein [Longimicrobium sp.]
MKKLKLKLDDLEISTFVAEGERQGGGTVHGNQITGFTYCYCTDNGDCYWSNYCSYPGQPNNTCYEGCMTNERGAC